MQQAQINRYHNDFTWVKRGPPNTLTHAFD